MATIKITENELKRLVKESVQRLLEFDEGFGLSGFDESEGGDGEETKKREKSVSPDMKRKRDVVTQAFSNKDGKSDVKRRGAIELLYHPKDEGEWDTYRSEFSKYLDPEDTAHVWDDDDINKLFNWLSNLL